MTESESNQPVLINAERLSEIAGLTRGAILRLYREGKLHGLKYGHRTLLFEADSALKRIIELGRAA